MKAPWLALPVLLATLAAAPPSTSAPSTSPAPPAPPGGESGAPAPSAKVPLGERLRFNPRERTATGIDSLEKKRNSDAVGAFDSALRLRPADPLARYNAGTARLDAGAAGAGDLLEQAARQASPELAPSALYNLGNARLAGGDAQAALDAYKEALRRKSDFADAKYNLELALRQLEQQQKQQQQQQEQQQQQQKQQPSQSQQQQQQQQPQQQPQQQASAPQEPEKSKQDGRPLPQFQDQADMSREQAASILQAVEALERDARRKQAAQAARTRAGVEEDW
ncbi:MAG: hypothetical protein U0X73_18980 [Thermoanaerobaculia bacterium]